MKQVSKFQWFLITVIIILIAVFIIFSQKRKQEFELVKNQADQVLDLIYQAGEKAQTAEKARPRPFAYGLFFNFDKVILFADENENRIFDDKIISEYKLDENIRLNQKSAVFYIPYQKNIAFCDHKGECFEKQYYYVLISDIKTGRAMEFRFEHKNGKVVLQEVVNKQD